MGKCFWRLEHFERLALLCVIRCLPHVSFKQIAKEFEVDHATVRYYARKLGVDRSGRPKGFRVLAATDLDTLAYLRDCGTSQAEMARMFKVSRRTVRKALNALAK